MKLKKIVVIIIFIFITACLTFLDNGKKYNFTILFTSFLISGWSIFKIFSSRLPYSTNQIFYIFCLFFFGISPALQYKNDITLWGNLNNLTSSDYLWGNVLILTIIFLYALFYNLFSRRQRNKLNSISGISLVHYLPKKGLIILISLLSLGIFAYSENFNILGMLFRGGFDSAGSPSIPASSLNAIVKMFVRPVPLVCLLLFKYYSKERDWLFEVFLLIIVLVSNSPFGMPRFQAGAFYIPLLFLYFDFLKRPMNFCIGFCGSLLLLFPFLGQFRDAQNAQFVLKFDTQMFLNGGYDSYQNAINVISADIITYGNQLLGVIFFFIPRKFWPDKPVGSGSFLAEEEGYAFGNISMNYFGEGFINFGFFGIFLFLILLAVVNAKLDITYWFDQELKRQFPLMFLVFLGLEFFILRGDLMSSFAYSMGILTSIYFTSFIVLKKTKIIL